MVQTKVEDQENQLQRLRNSNLTYQAEIDQLNHKLAVKERKEVRRRLLYFPFLNAVLFILPLDRTQERAEEARRHRTYLQAYCSKSPCQVCAFLCFFFFPFCLCIFIQNLIATALQSRDGQSSRGFCLYFEAGFRNFGFTYRTASRGPAPQR